MLQCHRLQSWRCRGFSHSSSHNHVSQRLGESRRCKLAKRARQQSAQTVASSDHASLLVNKVLEQIKDTDGGIGMSDHAKCQVDELLDQLKAIGKQQQPRPLSNPLLWGNYNVAYTSTGRAQSERGQPAGGRFRGRIGRALFRTTGVYQSVLQPDIATNKIEFRLFGLLPGSVALRGTVQPVGENEDTVKVFFQPPVLSIMNSIHIRIGPPSSVQLSTTYLDDRIRLGKGGRGSLFVFTRGGPADTAGMDQVGLKRTSPTGAVLLGAFFAALVLGAWSLFTTGSPVLQVTAVAMWVISGLMALVLRRGGIINPDDDKWQQQPQQQQPGNMQQSSSSNTAAAT
eukprot:jgi/Chrzof1/7690/Cz02g33030.t1